MRRLFFIIIILFPINTFAYEPTTTHSGLSQEIVDFYNLKFERKINPEQKEIIIQGSIDEDSPAGRVLNHFYDPVRNIGLNNADSAKKWASGEVTENEYSWPKAIEAYAEGNENSAFLIVGHILHLIEDMGVPDHTRNDAHLVGVDESPFEHWSSENKDRLSMDLLAVKLSDVDMGFYKKELIDDFFDFIANYSNRNFFSKDTIENGLYQYLEPVAYSIDQEYAYGEDSFNKEKIKLYINFVEENKTVSKVLITKTNTSVIEEYFDRLARQIIPTGAGVIDLFFREAEAAKEKYEKEKIASEEARNIASETSGLRYITQYIWQYAVKDNLWRIVRTVKQTFDSGLAYTSPVTNPISNLLNMGTFFAQTAGETAINKASEVNINTIKFIQKPAIARSVVTSPLLALENTQNNKSVLIPEQGVEPTETIKPQETIIPPPQSTFVIVPGFGGGGAPPPPQAEAGGSGGENLTATTTQETATTTATTTPEIITDTTPPDITAQVPTCDLSLVTGQCVIATSTILLSWTSASTDTAYYTVVIGNVSSATSSETEAEITLSQGAHNIYVLATDTSNNTGTSTTISLEYFERPIAISEIAWAGTASSTANEWIEIYNRSPHTINLSNVSIESEDGAPSITLSGSITSNEYYLIERTGDDTVPDIPADLVAPFSGNGKSSGLLNDGEKLLLVHHTGGADTLIDQTPDISACGGWCEGFDTNRSTMYRSDFSLDGSNTSAWDTDGFDLDDDGVRGSPREAKQTGEIILE